ncbi:MAG: hypothetical protein WDO14_08985 [Bacteroidota bacterium]
MKLFGVVALLCLPVALHAQTETFDIVTYNPPVGWKKNVTADLVSYSIVDNATGTWCQMAIYKSVAGSGNTANDFSSEWKALVKPESYPGAVEPTPTSNANDGWTYSFGVSRFKWQGKDSYVTLENISGYGVMATAHVSSNSDKYLGDVENFLKSLQLKKPVQPIQQSQPVQQSQPTSTTVTSTNPTPTNIIKVTDAAGTQGIKTSTTNFDDGWVSQPYADYVKVVKGSITVLLHYSFKIDDEMRNANDMGVYVWDRLIAPRYRATKIQVFKNDPYTYFKVYFVEADVTETATNKNHHVGLRVLISNGVASCVEIIAPTAAALQQEFPNQDKIATMPNYNKFAVSPGDIVGTWEESTSTALNMYNSYTGYYAGMSATAMASSWNIRGDGTYDSEHKGATGMVGNMSTYDEKYNGKYTLTPWDLTVTNRFKGKTDVYWCQYEAVRGGRVLHLQDKVATAMTYSLVKTK